MRLGMGIRRTANVLGRAAFYDAARLVELGSLIALVAWVRVLVTDPTLLARDVYSSFQVLSTDSWVALFAAAATFQAAGIVSISLAALRILGLGAASGLWAVVTLTFASQPTPTTATGVYLAMSVVTFLGTLYVAARED